MCGRIYGDLMSYGEVSANIQGWRDYPEILTDSLWILPSRDRSGLHSKFSPDMFHGAFIPQVAYQLIKRYTMPGDIVLDPMCGSGTSLIEGIRLGRRVVGWDINPEAIGLTKSLVSDVIEGDCSPHLLECSVRDATVSPATNCAFSDPDVRAQLAILHPPYHDIIKFSAMQGDLSNCKTLEEFRAKCFEVIYNCRSVLVDKGTLAVVIGDKYENGKVVPLGFYVMEDAIRCGFDLKGIVVKNYGETKGKGQNTNLWRYRAMLGGFYVFKHEYIYVLQKT